MTLKVLMNSHSIPGIERDDKITNIVWYLETCYLLCICIFSGAVEICSWKVYTVYVDLCLVCDSESILNKLLFAYQVLHIVLYILSKVLPPDLCVIVRGLSMCSYMAVLYSRCLGFFSLVHCRGLSRRVFMLDCSPDKKIQCTVLMKLNIKLMTQKVNDLHKNQKVTDMAIWCLLGR